MNFFFEWYYSLQQNLIHFLFLFIKDLGNLDSDPEGFARHLCRDLEFDDPEVAVSNVQYFSGCAQVVNNSV
jgi:hypothetical protein